MNQMTAKITTRRAQLAALLKQHFGTMSDGTVAQRVGAPLGLVQTWLRGEEVPDAMYWKRLCSGVNRTLLLYGAAYHEACVEQEAEESAVRAERLRNRAASVAKASTFGNPLADKLRPALALVPAEVVPAEPKPAKEKRPRTPIGALHSDSVAERRAAGRAYLEQHPRATQADVRAHVKATCGHGIDNNLIGVLRVEVLAAAEVAKQTGAPIAESTRERNRAVAALHPKPEPAGDPIPPTEAHDVEAAVQLVLSAVPNLRTFTIHVDDAGCARCDYTTREVKVVEAGGRVEVRRG